MHCVRGLLSSVLIFLMIAGQTPALTAQDSGSASAAAQSQAAQTPSTPPSAPQPQATAAKPVRMIDYSKPRSHFPNPIAPYLPHRVPEPSLQNSLRLEQLLQNGKLMLSLDDAIALALENNLDLAIARYNLNIADTDILLANSGQSTRGVNTGVVQGTLGVGTAGIGGTSQTAHHDGGSGGNN